MSISINFEKIKTPYYQFYSTTNRKTAKSAITKPPHDLERSEKGGFENFIQVLSLTY